MPKPVGRLGCWAIQASRCQLLEGNPSIRYHKLTAVETVGGVKIITQVPRSWQPREQYGFSKQNPGAWEAPRRMLKKVLVVLLRIAPTIALPTTQLAARCSPPSGDSDGPTPAATDSSHSAQPPAVPVAG